MFQRGKRRYPARASLFTVLGIAILASGANAQSVNSANTLYEFSIPRQGLESALEQFSRITRRQVSIDSRLVDGLSSEAVSGRLTAEAALAAMTRESGLEIVVIDDIDFALRGSTEQPPLPAGSRLLGEEVLDEIVVRGELLERTLQNTQTSVSIVRGDELDAAVDKDLFDLVDRLPGVNAQGGGFGFVIRGVADGGVAGGTQAISVQIDGASVPNGQALRTGSLSMWDLEQVEVLRGSQSTQQGPNSLAGAIVLRSKDPTFEREFKARADYGSFDETRIAVTANLPLSEQWALRLSAEDFRSDGDIEARFSSQDNASEFLKTYRAKLRFMPSETFDAVLTLTRSDNRLGNQSILEDEFPERRLAQQLNTEEGESDTITLRAEYLMSERWSVSSETAYLMSDYLLNTPLQPEVPGNTPAFRTVDDTSISQELKLSYAGERLHGVAGLYYQQFEKDLAFEAFVPDTTVVGLPPGSAIFANTLDNKIENLAVFTEFEYRLSNRWTVVAGLRYDNEQQDNVTTNSSVFTPDPLGFSANPEPVELDADYSALLPKIGVVYDFGNDTTLGFTAQRAYRAGGSATDNQSAAPYEFDPEYSNNYELSLRSLLAANTVTLNVNVFYTDYTDMQLSVPGLSNTFIDARIENAGAATLLGIELQASYRPTANLDLSAGVGYVDTEFDEYLGGSGNNVIDLAGNEFPQAPNLTGSLSGSYAFDNGFYARFVVSHTDDSYYTVNNLPGELNSPFTLVNAQIGYEAERWSANVYSRNLFDEQYLSRKRVDGASTAGDSRVVGLSVTANF